jgi:acetoin utilization deacetylase AcuC-like enzyme
MKFGYSDVCLQHDPGARHPEVPDRLVAIRETLSSKHNVTYESVDPVPVETIKNTHDADYVDTLREFCADGGGKWDPDTIAVEETWDAALVSAGLACWAKETAVAETVTPFSLGRPPGHHAVADDAMGFCFFNNVAVATNRLRDTTGVRDVAIFDWDVHHGNGTQAIFYDDPNVFYSSIHEEGLYPGTGAADEIGTGEAAGTTLNLPLAPGSGDAAYNSAMTDVIEPLVRDFDPDLMIISAGFDAHRHDPISRMRVSTEGFGMLTARVQALSNSLGASLAFILEGGYSLEMLGRGVSIVHDVLTGYTPGEPTGTLDATVREQLDSIRSIHGVGSK